MNTTDNAREAIAVELQGTNGRWVPGLLDANTVHSRYPSVKFETSESWVQIHESKVREVEPMPEGFVAEATYHVAYSPRLRSWYIADDGGECVSGMYDDEALAKAHLAEGAF